MRKTRGGQGEAGRWSSLSHFSRRHRPFLNSRASSFRPARFNKSPLYYLRAWQRLKFPQSNLHFFVPESFIFIPFYIIVHYLRTIFFFSSHKRYNQNLKFLHWASIFVGNLPFSALHALQYLFTPSSHFKNYFVLHQQQFCGIFIYFFRFRREVWRTSPFL